MSDEQKNPSDPSWPMAKSRGKKRFGMITGTVLILVLVLGGGFLYHRIKSHVGTNDALINGFIVELSSDLLLRITKLHVDEGYFVEEGELVCKLDDSILLSQKAEAEANIVALQSKLVQRTYELEKIKDDYVRAENAFKDSIISIQDFDHALKDYEIAKSAVVVAMADVEEAVKQLGVIEATLLHTDIRATSRGAIVKRWVQEGDVVQPGQAIFSLVNLDNIWVEANLQETAIRNVNLGDTVEIHVDAYPGVKFYGKVYVIKGASAGQFSLIPPDNATGNYTKVAQRIPLKITIDPLMQKQTGKPYYLFPGMSVEVSIKVD